MNQRKRPSPDVAPPRQVAAIDIGTTSIRMTIAQINADGSVHPLETLQQAVSIGKDTFLKGSIDRATIEESVRTLQSFRNVLDEYGIHDDSRIRAVATTAVCEAENRNAFIDRVYIANGIKVEPIDEVDATRLVYLSMRDLLRQDLALRGGNALVAEVGGGSTQVLFFHKGTVVFSQEYRLGSLRLREMLEAFRSPVTHQREVMENQIDSAIGYIQRGTALRHPISLVALGNDARFAASLLAPQWEPTQIATLPVASLVKFTERVLTLSVNELAREYHLSFPDAETLGPALLCYTRLARALKVRTVRVADVSMRHGLLIELAQQGSWAADFREQIAGSALEICRKYLKDPSHSVHVASLAQCIFDALKEEHRMGPWHEVLLHTACLLHDVGTFVSPRNHHKHSMYLIQNSSIFGLNPRDLALVAVVARYHRRAVPKQTHIEYRVLERESRITVVKLAAILRVADALDCAQVQRVRDIVCEKQEGRFVIGVPLVEDLSLEQVSLQNKGGMFEDVYGLRLVLRPLGSGKG